MEDTNIVGIDLATSDIAVVGASIGYVASSIRVGSTTTTRGGSAASVTATGTSQNQTLHFDIPAPLATVEREGDGVKITMQDTEGETQAVVKDAQVEAYNLTGQIDGTNTEFQLPDSADISGTIPVEVILNGLWVDATTYLVDRENGIITLPNAPQTGDDVFLYVLVGRQTESVAMTVDTVVAMLNAHNTNANSHPDKIQIVSLSSAISDAEFVAGDSTVNLVKTVVNTSDGSTSQAISPMPVASPSNPGNMNPAQALALEEHSARLDALSAQAYVATGVPDAWSQSDITNAWLAASGQASVINGAVLWDADNERRFGYFASSTGNLWVLTASDISGAPALATNTTPGLIKGSTLRGQNYAEADGSTSLNGFDDLDIGVAESTAHIADKNNPHNVTPAQIGAMPLAVTVLPALDFADIAALRALENGRFFISSGATNYPASGVQYAWLEVMKQNNDLLFATAPAGSNSGYGYSAVINGSTGAPVWRKLARDDEKVNRAGDTMTGELSLPTLAATGTGDSIIAQGSVAIQGQFRTAVAAPTAANHLTRKDYVDRRIVNQSGAATTLTVYTE